jgi:spore coat polysaccharide biosynthesis protein SpsF (cytidylyltransferase family)
MKRDIWTVTYNDPAELWLLLQQIESYAVFKVPNKYNIVINEDDTICERVKNDIQNHINKWSKKSKRSLDISLWNRSDLLERNDLHKNNYINQQLIKLAVHRLSDCEEHVVLDSKNIFLETDAANTVTGWQGKGIESYFLGCYEQCVKRWHNGKHIHTGRMSNPFVFENKVLKALEADFDSREDYYNFLNSPFELTDPELIDYYKSITNQEPADGQTRLSEFNVYIIFYHHYYNKEYPDYVSDNDLKNVKRLSRYKKPEPIKVDGYRFFAAHKVLIDNYNPKRTKQLIKEIWHSRISKTKPLTIIKQEPVNRDVWTIVFNDKNEIWLLLQQIESYFLRQVPNDFNIIINEDDKTCKVLRKKIQGHIGILEKSHKRPVDIKIWFRSDLLEKSETSNHGYINQQLLKLQLYRLSTYEEHVILDAKNIFMTQDAANKVSGVSSSEIHTGFIGCYEACCNRWFNKKLVKISNMANPFVFKNKILAALENDFDSREDYFAFLKQSFSVKNDALFKMAKEKNSSVKRENGWLSEFVVYCVFYNYYNKIKDFKFPIIPAGNRKNVLLMYRDRYPELPEDYNEHYFISYHRGLIKHYGKKAAIDVMNKLRKTVN